MHGTITKFRSDLGIGVIAADNGRKYRFSRQNVLNPRGDLVGHTVDFVGSYPLGQSLDLYVRVENAFDQQRITHRGADGARGNSGRWSSLGVRLRF